MGNLIEEFIGSMGSEVSQKMSNKTNIDQGTISQLLPVIAPMILGGLKSKKMKEAGRIVWIIFLINMVILLCLVI